MLSLALRWFRLTLGHRSSSDNFISKLCYRWTVLLLVAFSIVVTCRLCLGDSFSCLPSNYYANSNCYGVTFTEPESLFSAADGFFPVKTSAERYKKHQAYYPWVNLVLLVQAFAFYLPHLLWKSYEGGYMLRLTAGVQNFSDKEENRGLELCHLARHVLVTQGKHKLYTSLYVSFEACNCVVALLQTVWLVHFFDVTGVPGYTSIKLATWSDFEKFYFPQSGKCLLEFANDTSHSMLCWMYMNRLYMFMFFFLHTWYISVMILTGTVVVYRIALLIPSVRVFATGTRTSVADWSLLKSLCHRMSYSDWLFLTRLQKSMTDVDFSEMLDKIAIVAQDRDPRLDLDQRSSSFMDAMKYFDDSDATSPL